MTEPKQTWGADRKARGPMNMPDPNFVSMTDPSRRPGCPQHQRAVADRERVVGETKAKPIEPVAVQQKNVESTAPKRQRKPRQEKKK